MKKESQPAAKTSDEPQPQEASPQDQPPAKRPLWQRLVLILLTLVLLLAAALGGAGYYFYQKLEHEPLSESIGVFELKKGATALSASRALVNGRVPELMLHLYLREHPEYNAVQAGEYLVDGKKTLPELLQDMVEGKILERSHPTFTVVEGSTWPEIEQKIYRQSLADDMTRSALETPRRLHEQALGPELVKFMGGSSANLEGLLLPATYPVFDKKPFKAVLSHALRDMALFLREHWELKHSEVELSPYEILKVASIVERETLLDEERPLVAAVIYNRLKQGMRLQVDPTVMYGVSPTFRGRLTKDMLQKDTPYNSYTRDGLPPTPIGMPSKASILAALQPADSTVIFFVAKDISPQDGHVFTSTLKEHNQAVAEYRKRVREYNKQASGSKSDKTEADKAGKSKSDSQVKPKAPKSGNAKAAGSQKSKDAATKNTKNSRNSKAKKAE
ncbi:MAG: endolytic transglycosylase MltG [Succinivibrio sp.]|nr:endolytic transglycosylase MltG [Succinivibrio sp.]